jgi:cell division septation protein DedD
MVAAADSLNSAAPPPTLASVVVLRISEFSRKPVAEQARLKAQLDALVTYAIRPLPVGARVVLDAPEGVAIVVLNGPEAALDLAKRSQFVADDLKLCIGVNYGPVMSALDALRGPGLVGDGLSAGVTLSNASKPGRFVASRAYREALKASDAGRVRELGPAGTYTDAQLRAHELFALDWRPTFNRYGRLIFYGTLTVAAIIVAGFAVRFARVALEPTPPPKPGLIRLEITPRGDVYIDGALRGASPPLTEIEIDPGAHVIEVRNSPSPPLRLDLTVGSADEMTIRHAFVSPQPAAKSPPAQVAPPKKKPEVKKKPEAKAAPKPKPKPAEKPKDKTMGDYWRQFRRDIGL